MTYFTVTPIAIGICLISCLATCIIVRLILGEKRDLYFKRSTFKSVITIRGRLNDAISLGYPKNKTGFLIWAGLLCLLALEVTAILLIVPQ